MENTAKTALQRAGNMTTKAASEILQISEVTVKRWCGQSSRATEMPWAYHQLFMLLTDTHPDFQLKTRKKKAQNENINL